jgi:hypothetical protein
MNNLFFAIVCLSASIVFGWTAQGTETNRVERSVVEPMVLPDLRVSAIAGVEGQYFVGMVDQKTGQASLLRIGNQIAGYTITEIDPESKAVRLEKGGVPYRLELSGDSVRVVADDPETAPSAADMKPAPVKTMDEFLKEHPELNRTEGPAIAPSTQPVSPEEGLRKMAETAGKPFDPSMLKPRTFEDFVRENAPTNAKPRPAP